MSKVIERYRRMNRAGSMEEDHPNIGMFLSYLALIMELMNPWMPESQFPCNAGSFLQ